MKLHGAGVGVMDEEQAWHLNRLKMKQNIHIAWDLPQLDLTERLKEMVKYVKPYKITCYVLIGFNSTVEQDFFRPAEVELLIGNPAKAEAKLGWKREISFQELVERMVKNDLALTEKEVKAAQL